MPLTSDVTLTPAYLCFPYLASHSRRIELELELSPFWAFFWGGFSLWRKANGEERGQQWRLGEVGHFLFMFQFIVDDGLDTVATLGYLGR